MYIDATVLNNKKQFTYETIEQARGSVPEVTILKENFRMPNVGLMNNHLKYFETCEYRDEIKHIDLSDNQILDISLLLDHLTNIETIYVSKNFIKSI